MIFFSYGDSRLNSSKSFFSYNAVCNMVIMMGYIMSRSKSLACKLENITSGDSPLNSITPGYWRKYNGVRKTTPQLRLSVFGHRVRSKLLVNCPSQHQKKHFKAYAMYGTHQQTDRPINGSTLENKSS